ncbi:hypothetical protein AWRI1631_154770 [Saccharomyces cerevisiae AWRI1631]|uniref:Uncharacterized protein n=1 Tax=Saccharomyces cerevisiae (strain AWRI1631) TaxID=545124 RepID=B5VSK6_YEAS6|nr:hypothetical protein AWRI1631_154770 [Saccharomyces cerevisiae AWRI1631]
MLGLLLIISIRILGGYHCCLIIGISMLRRKNGLILSEGILWRYQLRPLVLRDRILRRKQMRLLMLRKSVLRGECTSYFYFRHGYDVTIINPNIVRVGVLRGYVRWFNFRLSRINLLVRLLLIALRKSNVRRIQKCWSCTLWR